MAHLPPHKLAAADKRRHQQLAMGMASSGEAHPNALRALFVSMSAA